jgi:hypothetical protein
VNVIRERTRRNGKENQRYKNHKSHRQQKKYSENFKGHWHCGATFVLALRAYFVIILFLNPPVNNET